MILLCVVTSLLFGISDPVSSVAIALCVILVYAALGFRFFLKGMRVLIGLWPFLILIGAWHIWLADYHQGIIILSRLISAVALANLVTMTTRLQDMIDFLVRVSRPARWFGLSPQAIGIAIALVIRFIPVLVARAQHLSVAYRARSGKRASWRIILPLVFSVLDDADNISNALRARGGV